MAQETRRTMMNAQETQDMLAAMESDKSGGKTSFWTPDEGENTIRFIPPLKPNKEVLPYFHHKVHWVDGTPYECVDQSFTDKNGNFHEAEPCPACKTSKKLYKLSEKDSEERQLAYDISAKDRYVFRIVDRKKEKSEQTTPEFYDVGPQIFKKFFNILKGGKYGNIVHPIEGRDYTIDKQGTGRRTNYDSSMPDPEKTSIFSDKEQLKEVLTKAVEMSYSSLIEFPKSDDLKVAVMEFLNPDATISGTSSGSKKTDNEDDDNIDYSSASGKIENTQSEKESDEVSGSDIDDILGEFV